MDQSQQNYLRIVAVLYGPGLDGVRCYFDRCFPPNLLNTQLSGVLRKRLEALKQKKVLSNAQWDILFPANGSASSALFDVALMTVLLRHFHIKKEPIDGYDKLPVDQDQTPAADLARIKYYRNIIAHSKDGAIDDTSYKETWKNLCEVVDRLGDLNLKKECELLGRADLDMTYKSQCEELSKNIETLKEHEAALESQQGKLASDLKKQGEISSKNENIIKNIVTDLKSKYEEAIRSLEEKMSNLKIQLDGMSERLYSQQSAIPHNIKPKIVRQIKKWIEDEKKYVIIDATVNVLDLQRKHSSLTVAGNAGCGKTALIRHLALRLMSDGYEIVPVIEPKTIVKYHDETKKQVFVFDDACGVHTVDRQKRTAWLDNSQNIKDCLLQSGSLLLVSVRLSILNSELFQDLQVLSQNIINLQHKKYALSLKNRQDIFRSYFKMGHEELSITVKSLQMHDAFPLLCKFSSSSFHTVADDENVNVVTKCDNDSSDLDAFFQTPIQMIESEIKSLRKDSPLNYCVLVLCLLFNGKLPKLDIFFSNKHKSLLEDCYSVCGLNRGTPIKTLSDIAKNLTNVYLKEVGGTLVFIHDILMDIVAVCFGDHSQDILFKYAHIEVIINRVQLKQITTEPTGYRIVIAEDHHADFFHRFFSEIEKGNACQVFNHGQLEIQLFQEAMATYLEKMSDDELRYIFFQVKDKEGNSHQKLRLKFMDIWAQILDSKPVKIECYSFLDLIVNNALQWLIGKGLLDIIMLLERRLSSDVNNELSNANSLCTGIAILGGSVETYSWILKSKQGRLWQYVSNKWFQKKYLIQDFQWAVIAGQTNIVEFLLNNEICQICINESITSCDMLSRYSVYILRMILFSLNSVHNFASKLNIDDEIFNFNLENEINLTEITCTMFYTEDENFNKLVDEKFKTDIEPIISKQHQHNVELQCSQFPLPVTIFDSIRGRMEARKTYLAYASFLGHESVVDLLLRKGANPNEISVPSNNLAKSCTALPVVYASMHGRLQIVQNLLRNGAKIDSTGPKGCTLLMFASSYGHYDLAKFLLDRHVDINATNIFQNTALLYASKKGHTDIVLLLLQNGAFPNTVCFKSSTPLIEAASGGYLEIVENLISFGSSVNDCDNKNNTALTKASENGHFTIVKILTENQVTLNIRTHDNETALMIACKRGHYKVVSILLQYLNECNNDCNFIKEKEMSTFENDNRTVFRQLPFALCSLPITALSDEINQALLYAYFNKDIDMMKVLLDNGANVQIKFFTSLNDSISMLNDAVDSGKFEIANLLLKYGAQVQKRANSGVPPLMIASYRGHLNIVQILLQNGSNINSTSEYVPIRLTFLEHMWTRRNTSKSDFQKIIEYNDIDVTVLICAIKSGCIRLIEELLQEKHININARTSMGRTALMIACGSCQEKIVELLLHNRANVNIRSKLGATALDIATCGRRMNENIIRALQQNGAVHSRDMIQFQEGYRVRHMRSLELQYEFVQIWNVLKYIMLLAFLMMLPSCE